MQKVQKKAFNGICAPYLRTFRNLWPDTLPLHLQIPSKIKHPSIHKTEVIFPKTDTNSLRVQGVSYVLGQGIMPSTLYSVMILNCF